MPGFLSAFRGLDFLTAASQVGVAVELEGWMEMMKMIFSFGKMEIGVSTCVVLPLYQRLSFFFVKNYGGTFKDPAGFIL